MNPADDIHRRTWDRIPWVVGGGADEAMRAEVEAHVAECAACRDEYAFQRSLRDALHLDDPPAAATEAALERFWQQVDSEAAPARARPVAREDGANRPGAWTRWLAAAVVVQAVALVLLIGERPAAPSIVTLSSQTAPAAAQLRLAPVPALTQAELQALLIGERLRVVEVSADARFYGVVAVPGTPALDPARLAQLRSRRELLLVEPVPR
jgi:hypothetical protein